MPGVGIVRCILTLEPARGASPPPRSPERADEAQALPPAHHSAMVADANKEKAHHG
jgi:hypothetical protein